MASRRSPPLRIVTSSSLIDPVTEESFLALCVVHSGALLRVASRFADNREDARDLVQETYLHAWERFHQLQDRSTAKPWLFQILRHLALERLRSRQRRTGLLDVTPLDEHHADRVPREEETVLDRLVAGATRARVRDAVQRLPRHYGVVVEQHDLQGLKYREIAEKLAIPIGTVMSRLNKGRDLLAAILVEPGDIPRAA